MKFVCAWQCKVKTIALRVEFVEDLRMVETRRSSGGTGEPRGLKLGLAGGANMCTAMTEPDVLTIKTLGFIKWRLHKAKGTTGEIGPLSQVCTSTYRIVVIMIKYYTS